MKTKKTTFVSFANKSRVKSRKKYRLIGGTKSTFKKSRSKSKIKKGDKKDQIDTNSHNFKQLQCSPNPTLQSKKDYSCLDDPTLHKLKELWNIRHQDVKIEATESRDIWNQLKEKLHNVCNKESCWLKQQFVENKLNKELTQAFAPKHPEEWIKKPFSWLSSMDILEVMTQYENSYKCFEFMGPTPIDFDKNMLNGKCVWPELCNFNLQEQINSKKTKVGIIFNTDKHTGKGKHWLSLFINIKKGEIFYFDSNGDKPGKEVKAFIDKVIEQGTKLASPIIFKYDMNHPTEHQKGTSACGMFSLFFIVQMLEDKLTGEYLKTHRIKDSYVESFRKVYFNEDI
jgi:hypothetical protein